jgi:integrase
MTQKISPHVSILQHCNGTYYALLRRSCARAQKFSLRTKNYADAVARVKQSTMEALASHRFSNTLTAEVITRLTAGKKTTLDDALERYLSEMERQDYSLASIAKSRTAITRFLRAAGLASSPVQALAPEHIDLFINRSMSTTKLSTRTRCFASISAFCSWLFHSGLAANKASFGVSVRTDGVPQELLLPNERKPFSDEELARLKASLPRGSFWWCIVTIVEHTGLRLSDAVNLRDTNIRGGFLEVMTAKRGVAVKHAITPELEAALSLFPREPVCLSIFHEMSIKHAADPGYLSTAFKKLCASVGIADKSFHGLRHSFCLKLNAGLKEETRRAIYEEVAEQIALEKTRAAMGHSSEDSTRHYLNHAH